MLQKKFETDLDIAFKALDIKVKSSYVEHMRNGIIFQNNGELYKLELKQLKRKSHGNKQT